MEEPYKEPKKKWKARPITQKSPTDVSFISKTAKALFKSSFDGERARVLISERLFSIIKNRLPGQSPGHWQDLSIALINTGFKRLNEENLALAEKAFYGPASCSISFLMSKKMKENIIATIGDSGLSIDYMLRTLLAIGALTLTPNDQQKPNTPIYSVRVGQTGPNATRY